MSEHTVVSYNHEDREIVKAIARIIVNDDENTSPDDKLKAICARLCQAGYLIAQYSLGSKAVQRRPPEGIIP